MPRPSVNRRTYRQYCHLAHALDAVGERWAMLVLRELFAGPKRFTDLVEGLPGIATNLLAARLRDLERDGVIRRTKLPPPAAVTVYELTELGADLRPALRELARWGAKITRSPRAGEKVRLEWPILCGLGGLFLPTGPPGVKETYELRIGGERFHASVEGGRARFASGPADDPAAVIAVDRKTFLDAFMAHTTPVARAVAEGRIRFEGEADAVARLVAFLGASPPRSL
jgi:DNA-binding HxlR family transcriptional regulator